MGLRAKIFAAFSVIVFGLLGTVVYVTNSETESYEIDRISHQLQSARERFQRRLDTQRAHSFRLVATITSDQKYRAFLEQMKDNFYTFAEEIARDTDSGLVIVVDEELTISGVSAPQDSRANMDDHVENMTRAIEAEHIAEAFEAVLDEGEGQTAVIALGDGLANAVFVPLKESARDDYALGVVLVANVIDDTWVRDLLGNEVDDLTVAFFAGERAVASDASQQNRRALIAQSSPEGIARVIMQSDRHLALTEHFEDAGVEAGYVVAGNLDRALKPIAALQRQILLYGLGVLLIGLVITLAASARIVQPIRRLVDVTHHVLDGDYSYRVENHSSDEVGELTSAFQNMVEGLQEKEQIRNLFGKYVHPSIVSGLIDNPDELGVGGKNQVQTLMFSDIAGFVGISADMSPEETVEFLNEYLGEMTNEITRTDGIMAFFGPPFTPGNHAMAACRAALRMDRRLGELRERWLADGLPPIRARIGLATGEVIVGNIGSEQTRDYTCIGENVNVASRLEGVNKYYGTSIIIDAGTRDLAGTGIEAREIDIIKVMGSEHPVRIFELLGLSGETPVARLEVAEAYHSALAHYRGGRFEDAAAEFDALANGEIHDPPSRILAQRSRAFITDPPEHWEGVYAMDQK